MKSTIKMEMICPCCGEARSVGATSCDKCNARNVAEAIAQPDRKLPSLGPSLIAIGLLLAVICGFFAAWLLSHDLKVLRVAAVALLGDGNFLARSLLQGDPDLLRYRIFSFDAYRLASNLSFVLAPISLFVIWLGRRAHRLASNNPVDYGGRRMAVASLYGAAIMFVVFSAAGISAIPRAIQNGRAKHVAETRARFYHLHVQALTRYYQENGTYPQELSDISAPEGVSSDYWGNPINYTPTALIASKKGSPLFSNYQLVSAGPDGILDTVDDIRMIDGVIVIGSEDVDPISGFPTAGKKDR